MSIVAESQQVLSGTYVLDTGIRISHVDFGGRAVAGKDAIGTTNMSGTDCNGHGTHVAGILGGSGYGVAKDVDGERQPFRQRRR